MFDKAVFVLGLACVLTLPALVASSSDEEASFIPKYHDFQKGTCSADEQIFGDIDPKFQEILNKNGIDESILKKLKSVGIENFDLFSRISDQDLDAFCDDEQLALSIVEKIKFKHAVRKWRDLHFVNNPKKHVEQQNTGLVSWVDWAKYHISELPDWFLPYIYCMTLILVIGLCIIPLLQSLFIDRKYLDVLSVHAVVPRYTPTCTTTFIGDAGNVLCGTEDFFEIDASYTAESPWIIFKRHPQSMDYFTCNWKFPTAVALRTDRTPAGSFSFRLYIGSSEKNDWIPLNGVNEHGRLTKDFNVNQAHFLQKWDLTESYTDAVDMVITQYNQIKLELFNTRFEKYCIQRKYRIKEFKLWSKWYAKDTFDFIRYLPKSGVN